MVFSRRKSTFFSKNETFPETPTNFGVRGIPTLIMFKDGQAVATHSGAMTKSKLAEWVNSQMA